MGIPALYSRTIANNIPGPDGPTSYTLFSDSQDSKKFYILPEFPTFLPDRHKGPTFSMIWYFGTGYKAGGVCTFTVALPLPDINNPEVKKKLSEAIGQDAAATEHARQLFDMAKAHHDGNPTKADSIAGDLGLTQDQAQGYYKDFDPAKDYAQFLPDDDGLRIEPLPLLSGKVTVIGFGGPEAFQTWQQNGDPTVAKFAGSYETTPSLLNNNAAVVSFDLSDLGANLFWHALGGPSFDGSKPPEGYDPAAANSVVAVIYTVSFDAMLPAATATVTLHRDTVVSLIKETHQGTNTWGQEKTWEETVGKKYQQTIKDSTKIEVPSTSYLNTEAGKKNIEETLTEWAQKQLENMIQTQMPDIKLDDVGKPFGSEQLEAIHDDERTYELSRAFNLQVNPQAQLRKVSSYQGIELDNYFQVIDLNDKPYFNVNMGVNPPTSQFLKDRGIDSIVVTQINFAGEPLVKKTDNQQVGSLPFNSSQPDLSTVELIGTFGKNREKAINYSYMVTYTDGTTPYKVNGITQKPDEDGYYVNFTDKAKLGVVYAVLDGQFLPWGSFDRVRVDVKYGNDINESFLLTENKKQQTLAKPLGRLVDGPLQYKAIFYLKGDGSSINYPSDGNSYKSVNITTESNVVIETPFASTKNIKFELKTASGYSAVLSVKYQLPMPGGLNKTFEEVISLPAGDNNAKSFTWTVPTPKDGDEILTIDSASIYDSEGNETNPTLPTNKPKAKSILIFQNKINAN